MIYSTKKLKEAKKKQKESEGQNQVQKENRKKRKKNNPQAQWRRGSCLFGCFSPAAENILLPSHEHLPRN